MGVSLRVIPCLDVDAGRVVKGVNFANLRDAGDPVELAARYGAEGADEVTFLDVSASASGRETMVDVVRRTAEQVFVPLTVGGGVRTTDDVERVAASRRGQGGRQHGGNRAAGADRRDRAAVREPGSGAVRRRASMRRTASPRLAGTRSRLTAVAAARESTRSSGRGAAPSSGRGRDPAQLDGRRRHHGRIRPRDDQGGARRGERTADRLRRRRDASRTSLRPPRPAPTPCSRRASSTLARSPSARSRTTCARPGSTSDDATTN